jgi:pimeloyl-ACP methyl ester carboxylesterase
MNAHPRRLVKFIALAAGLAYLGLVGTLYVEQDRLLFPADQGALDVAAAGVPGLRAVTLHTGGLALTAWYKPAPPGAPTVLYLHGNSGSLMTRLGRMRLFDGLGWGELFLEYPGYGGNPGRPSQDGFDAAARAALSYLGAQGVPAGKTILYGESLGTGVAVRLATEAPVGAVVLDSPYTSIAAVAQERYWYVPAALLIRNPFPLRTLIAGIHAPLLIMQGGEDQVVPPAMGVADFDAAVDPKQFWRNPTAHHDDVLESGGAAVMVAFVNDRLK